MKSVYNIYKNIPSIQVVGGFKSNTVYPADQRPGLSICPSGYFSNMLYPFYKIMNYRKIESDYIVPLQNQRLEFAPHVTVEGIDHFSLVMKTDYHVEREKVSINLFKMLISRMKR